MSTQGHMRGALAGAAWSGALTGAALGVLDGLDAARVAQVDAAGALATLGLCAGTHTLVGGALGLLVGAVLALSRWGRRDALARERVRDAVAPALAADGEPGGWRPVVARGLAALVPAGTALALVIATAARMNRLLAGGLVALAALGGHLLVLALAPALGRVLGQRHGWGGPARGAGWMAAALAHLVSLAPLPLAAFLLVARSPAPLRGPALARVAGLVALAVGCLALAAAWAGPRAARLAARRRWGGALLATVLLLMLAALGLWVRAGWDEHFQFLPWRDLILLAALGVVGTLAHELWRGPRRIPGWLLAPALVLALGLVAVASRSEAARKAAAGRAGLAGPLLAGLRRASDLDRDGHPRWFGGGDCDDRDPAIHPAALDWPGDGIDQDCDGHDAELRALASPPYHAVPAAVPAELNLVLIAIDTLRADHLGAYGYPRATSPAIDALAAEGALFEGGWAHAPSTRYSMPALYTGRWPSAIDWRPCHGCDSWWPRIGANRTLGEVLRHAGYHTGALWAYHYFDARWARGFERGIDDYQSHRAELHRNLGGPAESSGSSAREITDDAITFVRANRDRRFFLSVHYYDPHMNYEEHPGTPRFGEPPGATAVDRYDHEIAFTDQQLGRLLAALRELGLWDRTAILVTGDHGEGLGERGIFAHGYHLYPPQTRVPFILRVPGLPARRVREPVGHVDVAPTFANLARAPHEPSFLGRSFLDLAAGAPSRESPPSPWVFQEVSYENDNRKRALVTATHQLIWNWTPHDTTECYRLAPTREGTGPDLWDTAGGSPECPALKRALREKIALLALPPDFAARLARDLTPPGESPPAPTRASAARFGEAIALRGHDLSPPVLTRGEPGEVTLHFEALRAPPEGFRLFVHLVGPDGATDNLDHVPLGGAHPVERWRPGQHLRDRFPIAVAPGRPPGEYRLLVGFWRGRERLPVTPAAPEHRFEAARIQVR